MLKDAISKCGHYGKMCEAYSPCDLECAVDKAIDKAIERNNDPFIEGDLTAIETAFIALSFQGATWETAKMMLLAGQTFIDDYNKRRI